MMKGNAIKKSRIRMVKYDTISNGGMIDNIRYHLGINVLYMFIIPNTNEVIKNSVLTL